MSAFKGSVMNPVPGRNPYRFGEIPEYPVGSKWPGRRELCDAGVHADLTGGIHGRGQEGAFSVVLSGGYEDDVDNGYEFTYTGQGGQAKREEGVKWSSKQIKDQEWRLGNLALKTSCRRGKPVRVIRGSRLNSTYAPTSGYRYDGLYNVIEAEMIQGKSEHAICSFKFRRCPNQLPLPDTSGPPAHIQPKPKRVVAGPSPIAGPSTFKALSSARPPSSLRRPLSMTSAIAGPYTRPTSTSTSTSSSSRETARALSPQETPRRRLERVRPPSTTPSFYDSVRSDSPEEPYTDSAARLKAIREERKRKASLSNQLGGGYKIPKAPEPSTIYYKPAYSAEFSD